MMRNVFRGRGDVRRSPRASPAMRRSSDSGAGACGVEVRRTRTPGILEAAAIELVAQARVAERVFNLRLLHHEAQLARAIERHRRDHDAAGLEHGEPASREHRRVRRAQQHAVAGLEREVVHEDARDTICGLAGGPRSVQRSPSGTEDAAPAGAPFATCASRRRAAALIQSGYAAKRARSGARASLRAAAADPRRNEST